MSFSKLPEEEITRCKKVFEAILDKAELDVDRDYLNYDELKEALVTLTQRQFKHPYIIYKLISEIESKTQTRNHITFVDLLNIYQE